MVFSDFLNPKTLIFQSNTQQKRKNPTLIQTKSVTPRSTDEKKYASVHFFLIWNKETATIQKVIFSLKLCTNFVVF